jgi:hypothetical protein
LLLGAGVVNATYGLPSRSSVNPANGDEVSCPTPASYASCGVHVFPPSSDHATNRLWNDWSCDTLHPVAGLAGSEAIQATKMRPGCAPAQEIASPVGTVLHAESASATFTVKLAMTSIGFPNVFPPSVETFTQIWLGP